MDGGVERSGVTARLLRLVWRQNGTGGAGNVSPSESPTNLRMVSATQTSPMSIVGLATLMGPPESALNGLNAIYHLARRGTDETEVPVDFINSKMSAGDEAANLSRESFDALARVIRTDESLARHTHRHVESLTKRYAQLDPSTTAGALTKFGVWRDTDLVDVLHHDEWPRACALLSYAALVCVDTWSRSPHGDHPVNPKSISQRLDRLLSNEEYMAPVVALVCASLGLGVIDPHDCLDAGDSPCTHGLHAALDRSWNLPQKPK